MKLILDVFCTALHNNKSQYFAQSLYENTSQPEWIFLESLQRTFEKSELSSSCLISVHNELSFES